MKLHNLSEHKYDEKGVRIDRLIQENTNLEICQVKFNKTAKAHGLGVLSLKRKKTMFLDLLIFSFVDKCNASRGPYNLRTF